MNEKNNRVTELFLYGSVLVILIVVLLVSLIKGENKEKKDPGQTQKEKVEQYIEENELELVNPDQEVTGDFFNENVKGDAWEEQQKEEQQPEEQEAEEQTQEQQVEEQTEVQTEEQQEKEEVQQ